MSRERAGKTEACRVIEPGTKHCPVQWKRERERLALTGAGRGIEPEVRGCLHKKAMCLWQLFENQSCCLEIETVRGEKRVQSC